MSNTLKLRYTTNNGMSVVYENPDAKARAEVADRFRAALFDEENAFLQEVGLALRKIKLKPGQKRVFRSKPLVITIEAVPDEEPSPTLPALSESTAKTSASL